MKDIEGKCGNHVKGGGTKRMSNFKWGQDLIGRMRRIKRSFGRR